MDPIDLEKLVQLAAAPGEGLNHQTAAEKALAESGLDKDAVDTLQVEAVEKFRTLMADNPTGDNLSTAKVLADVITATSTEQARIETVSAEAQAELDKLLERVETVVPTPATTDADPGTPPAEPVETPAEPVVETPVVETPAETVVEPEPALVAAATKPVRTVSISSINRTPVVLPQQVEELPSGMAIVAGGDVRGYNPGTPLKSLREVARAATARIDQMPKHGEPGIRIQSNIASFRPSYADDEIINGPGDHTELIERVADRSRLQREPNGMVAAGGWCSPSETDYSLVPDLSSDSAGLIDVPDIAVKRGGIRTPATPDYSGVFATGGNLIANARTEVQENPADLANYVPKPFYRIPCTDWTETRAGVVFTGIEAGILQNDAYPELGERHVELAVNIHRHKYNANTIAQMVAGSTAWDGTGFGPSATNGVLNGVGFLSKHLQYKYRSESDFLLEWVFPDWEKEVIRADYSLRSGIPMEQVTDAQIDAWFAARNARVQWVYDWQDAYTDQPNGFGAATAPKVYPNQVVGMAYPAGTWVRGRGDVISLDAVYDSVNIKRNDFLRLFMEESLLVHKRAYVSYKATFNTGVTGITSAPQKLVTGGNVAPAA